MALDVKVKIELSKTTGSVGFGVPLLLECGVETPVDFTVCHSMDDVVGAGFDEDANMYKAANMIFVQENRPEKIAICQTAETIADALPTLVSKDWRQLVIVGAGVTAENYVAAADYIEATSNKMLFIGVTAEEFDTFITAFEGKSYDRTVIFVSDTENAVVGLVGVTAGRSAGSFTYKFKTIKNVVAQVFTDAEINNIHEHGAFAYVTKAGDDITTEGFSQSGRYIDITDGIDYVIQNVEYKAQKAFNSNAKVSYDDKGIALLESAVVSALQDAFNNGIIATKEDGVTPDYTVSFASRAQTTEAERETRVYKQGSFSFALAGAIHECHVYGTITY